jgi:hypothetical protein
MADNVRQVPQLDPQLQDTLQKLAANLVELNAHCGLSEVLFIKTRYSPFNST